MLPQSLPQDAPLVSIIFAARDEAEKLPAAIETLLAQDYPRFEVIAVNDRSTDQTPAILHEFERTSRNLIVTDIASLPPGWLGKPHALVAGFEKSRGDWLVFTDADVHFAPDVLRRAVALAAARQWDHLTLLTSVEMRGFWETAAISYFGLGFVFGNEPWLASNPRSARYVGVGAFQLVRRAAYEKSGGHARLRMDVIEDMKLGKLMKMAGFRSGVAVAQDMVHVRWHSGVHNVIRGVTKNMFAAVHYNPFFAVAAMMLSLTDERSAIFRPGLRVGMGARVCRDRGRRRRPDPRGNDLVDGRFPALRAHASARRAAFLLDDRALGHRDALARRRRLARHILSAGRIAQRNGLKWRRLQPVGVSPSKDQTPQAEACATGPAGTSIGFELQDAPAAFM